MDALFWFAVGAATGITLTAIELRHRWLSDRKRLTNALTFEQTCRINDNAFHRRYIDKLQRELNEAIADLYKAHHDLHTAKSARLESWKGGNQ